MDKAKSGSTGTEHARRKIIVIDDEPAIGRILSVILSQDLRADVNIHRNAEPVLDILEGDPDAADLVISDISMPGLDGVAFSRSLHRINPSLPVILLTGYAMNQPVDEPYPANVRALFLKPFFPDKLLPVVRELLAESKPVAAAAS